MKMETTMTIEQVNDLLENYEKGELIIEHRPDNYDEDKNSGEEGSRIEVRTTKIPGTFVRIEYHSDSYGDNEALHSLKLVKPVTKTVTDYE